MAALPNIGGALCLTPQSLADVHSAKMRNLLKLAGVPQTTGLISAASGPKFIHHIVGTSGGDIAA